MLRLFLLFCTALLPLSAFAQSPQQLLQYARTFPPMPQNAFSLNPYISFPNTATVSAGSPCSDLEWTVFDSDYLDGETDGYDIFCPVDPSRTFPGANKVKLIECVSKLHSSELYNGAKGVRIILGTDEHPFPFFYRGADQVDNDYYVIQHFDYRNGHIQLRGQASDYGLVYADAQTDSVQTTGWYLFYTADGSIDLIAFIHACDDVTNDQIPSFADAYCTPSGLLNLNDPIQFRYAQPIGSTPTYLNGRAQVGGSGKEVISGLAVDPYGNSYLFGLTDSNLEPSQSGLNELLVTQTRPDGSVGWVLEVPASEASLLFDAEADSQYLYAAGRTYGSLPGFANQGKWDGILLKIDLQTGTLVATEQFGTRAIDGFGNIVLDDAGALYVSGAGAPPNNTALGDSAFLVAKYDRATLQQIWLATEPVLPTAQKVAEAWGGLTYVPSGTPGLGRLVVAGWFINTSGNGADGFVALYGNVDQAYPTRLQTQVISTPGFKADWVWGNTVDAQGNIYVAGYTSGNLQGAAQGQGDAFLIKYDANLQNPVYRQVGTPHNERFRSIAVHPGTGDVYVAGYTYGDWVGPNRDANRLSADVIVQRYNANLVLQQSQQLGTPQEERGFLAWRQGQLYLGGMTEGSFCGPNQGSFDGFVTALDPLTLLPSNPVLSVDALPTSRALHCFPNPSTGQVSLTYDGSSASAQLWIYNGLGQIVAHAPTWTSVLELGHLPRGVYHLVVMEGGQPLARQALVLE